MIQSDFCSVLLHLVYKPRMVYEHALELIVRYDILVCICEGLVSGVDLPLGLVGLVDGAVHDAKGAHCIDGAVA